MKQEWVINATIHCSHCAHRWTLRSDQALMEETVMEWAILVFQQHAILTEEEENNHEM